MPITSEAKWLACADPRGLAWHCKDRNDESRFRWLVVRWGERIRPLLFPDEASFVSAFEEWASSGGTEPRYVPDVEAYLTRIGEPPRDAALVFVGELSRDWLIYAAAAAVIAAARVMGPFAEPNPTDGAFCQTVGAGGHSLGISPSRNAGRG